MTRIEETNDGWPDVWVLLARNLQAGWSWSGFETSTFFINDGSASFVDVAPVIGADQVSDGRALAAGDIDGDGDIDLVGTVANVLPQVYVLRNDLASPGHHLFVELVASENRSAAGASVRVRAGERVQRRDVALGSGFLSQHDLACHFGLGDAARIEQVEITWPDGEAQTLSDLPADTRIRVTQGVGVETLPARRAHNANATGRVAEIEWDRRDSRLEVLARPYSDLSTFEFPGLGGEPIELVVGPEGQEPGGPVLLLHLWASWCASCRREMPELIQASEEAPGGLRIIGLNLDADLDEQAVRETVEQWGIPFPVAHMTGGRFDYLMEQLRPVFGTLDPRTMTLPTSLLLSPSGKVVAKMEGKVELDELLSFLRATRGE